MTIRRGDEPYYVYRCYGADGDLLYIGYTVNPQMRMAAHRLKSTWYGEVARCDFARYPNHVEAYMEETRAIAVEDPRHNVAGRAA
jgi:predicted GIY-YIG superfamily endonuclease